MSVPVPAPVSGGLLTADALEAPTAPRETNQANLVPRRIIEPDANFGAIAAAQRLEDETNLAAQESNIVSNSSGGNCKDAKWRLRGDEPVEEVLERYGELRKDHSRLKAQNALLKTGVLDEREKVKSLEAGIEERDRELRRLRAEQDKLNMLNNSYKARIDKLRSELEEESKSKAQQGSAWDVLMLSSSGPNQQQQLIAKFKTLKRELTTKTEECEQLHLQVADLKNAHRFSSETLETRLQEMRTSCAERDETIAKLERDKARFDRRLQQELSDRDAYFETLQRQLQTIAKERDAREMRLTQLNCELGCALTTLDHKFRLLSPFDTLRHPRLTALDLAPHARPRRIAQLDVCRSLSSWLLHCRARISELARPLALKVFLPHLLPSSIDPKATLDRSVTAHVESLLESDPLLSAFETEAKRMNPVDESGDTSTSASDYLSSYCDKYRTIVESLAALSTVVLHALKRAEGGSTQSPSFKLVSAQQAAAEAAEKEKAMFGRRNLIDTPHSQRAQTEFMQRQNMWQAQNPMTTGDASPLLAAQMKPSFSFRSAAGFYTDAPVSNTSNTAPLSNTSGRHQVDFSGERLLYQSAPLSARALALTRAREAYQQNPSSQHSQRSQPPSQRAFSLIHQQQLQQQQQFVYAHYAAECAKVDEPPTLPDLPDRPWLDIAEDLWLSFESWIGSQLEALEEESRSAVGRLSKFTRSGLQAREFYAALIDAYRTLHSTLAPGSTLISGLAETLASVTPVANYLFEQQAAAACSAPYEAPPVQNPSLVAKDSFFFSPIAVVLVAAPSSPAAQAIARAASRLNNATVDDEYVTPEDTIDLNDAVTKKQPSLDQIIEYLRAVRTAIRTVSAKFAALSAFEQAMLALGATSPSSRRINQTIIDQLTLLGDLLGAFENLMLQYRVLLLQDLAQSPLLASFLMADAFSASLSGASDRSAVSGSSSYVDESQPQTALQSSLGVRASGIVCAPSELHAQSLFAPALHALAPGASNALGAIAHSVIESFPTAFTAHMSKREQRQQQIASQQQSTWQTSHSFTGFNMQSVVHSTAAADGEHMDSVAATGAYGIHAVLGSTLNAGDNPARVAAYTATVVPAATGSEFINFAHTPLSTALHNLVPTQSLEGAPARPFSGIVSVNNVNATKQRARVHAAGERDSVGVASMSIYHAWSGARDPAALTQLAHLHHVHSDLKQTAASYISHLRKPSTTSGTTATQLPTVPYAEALSLRVQLEKEHSTRKSLEKQLATLTTEHTDLQSRHSQLRDVLRAAQAALISAQQQHEQTVHDLAVAKTEVQRLSGVQTQARLLLAATLTQQSTPADVTGVQSMMQATTTSVNASSTPSTNQNSSWISAVQSLSEPSSQPSARVPLGRLLNPASASNAPSLTPSTSLQPVLDVNTIANGSASAWWDEVATEFACVRQLLTAQSDADRKLAELALLAQKEESSGGSIAQRMSAAVQSKGLTAQQQAQLQQQQQLQSNAELIQRKLAWICVTLLMFGRLNLPSAPSTSPATPLVVGATSTPATQTLQMQPFQSAGTLSLTLRAAAPAGRRNTHYYQPFYRLRVPAASWLSPDLSWSHFRQQCAAEGRRSAVQHQRSSITHLIDTEDTLTRWQAEVDRSHNAVREALDVQRTAEAECEHYKGTAAQFELDFRRMQTSYQNMVAELTDHICTLTERLATKDASFLPANEDAREHAMRRLTAAQTRHLQHLNSGELLV